MAEDGIKEKGRGEERMRGGREDREPLNNTHFFNTDHYIHILSPVGFYRQYLVRTMMYCECSSVCTVLWSIMYP